MRRLSTIFVISAMVFVAVFGVFFMRHIEGEPHVGSDCVLGAIGNTSCENILNPLASIAFHMKALLQPAVISIFVSILALAALVMLGLALLSEAGFSGPPLAVALASAVHADYLASRKFRTWLTVFEKRDPLSIGAVSA